MRINRSHQPEPGPADPSADASEVPFPPFAAHLDQPRDDVQLLNCFISPDKDGWFHLFLSFRAGASSHRGALRLPYAVPVKGLAVETSPLAPPVTFSPAELLAAMSGGYRLDRAAPPGARPGGRPRVAFTVRWSNSMGGGTLNLYRWINWLAEAGVDIGVYSSDPPPAWTTLNAKFHHLPDGATRYRAISEPLVVVYSVVELPGLLQHGKVTGKRVYHLCQGAEEFHVGPPPEEGLLAPNAAFDLLNSLPVGRLVVSPHLQSYFAAKYRQRTHLVTNGVDLSIFSPGPLAPRREPRVVLCAGSTAQPLKGIATVHRAVALVAERHPEWRLHFVNVAGSPVPGPPDPGGPGFTGEYRCGLDATGMRDLYRSADVFVNASWYEGFGLPAVEAMACGVPVVQRDNHGLAGLAQDGRDCLTATPGDAGSIARALERVLSDDALRQRLVAGGLATAGRLSLDRQRRELLTTFGALTGFDLFRRNGPPAGAP